MLFEVSLRRASAVFHRIAPGIQNDCGDHRIAVEDIRYDGMEDRVCSGPAGCRQCGSETAESFDFESGVDFAEGCAGGGYRAAGIGGADAWGVCETAKVCGRSVESDS